MNSYHGRQDDPAAFEQQYQLSESEKNKIDKMRTRALFIKAKRLFDDMKSNKLNINKYKDNEKIKAIRAEVILDAEKILSSRFSPSKAPTEFDASVTSKVCLALTYARPNWTELHDAFRLLFIFSIEHHQEMMKIKEAKNTLHALAHIGFPKNWEEMGTSSRQVLIGLLNVIEQNIDESNEKLQSNVLWDISNLNMDFNDIQPVCVKIINKMLDGCCVDEAIPLSRYNDFDINQIRDFIGNYKADFSAGWIDGIKLLTDCCEKRAYKIALDRPASSTLQAEIVPYIKKHVVSVFIEEHYIAGGYADLYFPKEKVIIEFDGKSHTDSYSNLNASTRHRQRIASKHENLVVRISSNEWNAALDKDEFIIRILINAGIPVMTVKQVSGSSTKSIALALQSNSADIIKAENLPSLSITIQNIAAIPALTFSIQNPNAQPVVSHQPQTFWIPIRRENLKRNLDEMQRSNGESNVSDEPSSKSQRDSSYSSPSF